MSLNTGFRAPPFVHTGLWSDKAFSIYSIAFENLTGTNVKSSDLLERAMKRAPDGELLVRYPFSTYGFSEQAEDPNFLMRRCGELLISRAGLDSAKIDEALSAAGHSIEDLEIVSDLLIDPSCVSSLEKRHGKHKVQEIIGIRRDPFTEEKIRLKEFLDEEIRQKWLKKKEEAELEADSAIAEIRFKLEMTLRDIGSSLESELKFNEKRFEF